MILDASGSDSLHFPAGSAPVDFAVPPNDRGYRPPARSMNVPVT